MQKNKWFLLQLFGGEGAGAGAGASGAAASGDGGEGAQTGENTVDAEQQRLLELGVPKDKIRKRSKNTPTRSPYVSTVANAQGEEKPREVQKDDSSEMPTEVKENAPVRMTWDEIMKDPEYNKQMQAVVQSRVKNAKAAEETLAKLTPALELLARRHGLDTENIDYDKLTEAIGDDDSYYESRAIEMGVPVETAKKIDKEERETARKKREEERNLEEEKIRKHFDSLESQGNELKKTFPSFDLAKELENTVFARMTHPSVGISVEDAYHAVHRKEIMTAGMQVAAQQTALNISNAIQSGARRPIENGTSAKSPSVTTFDYSKASREERAALKREIYAAKQRGEKLYPRRG